MIEKLMYTQMIKKKNKNLLDIVICCLNIKTLRFLRNVNNLFHRIFLVCTLLGMLINSEILWVRAFRGKNNGKLGRSIKSKNFSWTIKSWLYIGGKFKCIIIANVIGSLTCFVVWIKLLFLSVYLSVSICKVR